ncbi:MAG TPA: hypothetical protein VK897_15110 [Anaerolineales bacterium]|nr:hypothetical protein [Anaerolineales bacterium]
MQKQSKPEASHLLEEAEQFARQGEREKAYQSSLKATTVAPDEPLAWYLRSRMAPSNEERLMCLSRAYSLDPNYADTHKELRTAVHTLLKQEPFLAYVYETADFYQVRSGRDLLINIPKNRTFETPYLKRPPGLARPAFRWLFWSLLALFLGGVGAVLLAPIAAFQALRLHASAPSEGERVRLLIVFLLAVIVWLAAIPISWLLLIRFYPS